MAWNDSPPDPEILSNIKKKSAPSWNDSPPDPDILKAIQKPTEENTLKGKALELAKSFLTATANTPALIDTVSGNAATRSALYAAQEGKNPLSAGYEQYKTLDSNQSPSGQMIAERAGIPSSVPTQKFSDQQEYWNRFSPRELPNVVDAISPSKLAGAGIEMVASPLPLVGPALGEVSALSKLIKNSPLGKKIGSAANSILDTAVRSSSELNNIPESTIRAYASPEGRSAFNTIKKSSGGDRLEAANITRSGYQDYIKSFVNQQHDLIDKASQAAGTQKNVDIAPIVDSLKAFKSKLNPKLDIEAINQINELQDRVNSLGTTPTENFLESQQHEALSRPISSDSSNVMSGKLSNYQKEYDHIKNNMPDGPDKFLALQELSSNKDKYTAASQEVNDLNRSYNLERSYDKKPTRKLDIPADIVIDNTVETNPYKILDPNGNPISRNASRISPKDVVDTTGYLQDLASSAYQGGAGSIFKSTNEPAKSAKETAAIARRLRNEYIPDVVQPFQNLEAMHKIDDRLNPNLIRPETPAAALNAAVDGGNQLNYNVLKDLEDLTGKPFTKDAQNLSVFNNFYKPSLTSKYSTGKSLTGVVMGAATHSVPGAVMGAALSSPMALKAAIDAGIFSKDLISKLTGSVGKLTALDYEKAFQILKSEQASRVMSDNPIERRINRNLGGQ